METKVLRPYLIIITLLLASTVLLGISVDVRVTDEAGISLDLPEKIGDWNGREILFCQSPNCMREVAVTATYRPETCPNCDSEVDTMTLGEKNLLPPDTVILKKRYYHPVRGIIYCTIVLSGKDRASIHRPEVCINGQGRKITDNFIVTIPFEERPPLDVKVLDLLYSPRQVGDEPPPRIASYYAYWFVGKNRETPYHWERMLWMGFDRVFKNVAHKWAYISVAGGRDKADIAYKKDIEFFVSELYPKIALF